MVANDHGASSGDERGQALTLEAVTASLILLIAVGFALQMTAVTPLSASTSSQHLENQLQATGEGVLASTEEDGSLKEAVLDWDEEEQAFDGSDEAVGHHRAGPPPNDFGDTLAEVYGERNIAYNVVVHYHTEDGNLGRQVMVRQGDPSDHAVSSSRTVALVGGDRLQGNDSHSPTLREANFYAPDTDIDGERPLYNLVRVEVIAWRI